MVKPEEKKAGVGATEHVVKKEDERKLCAQCEEHNSDHWAQVEEEAKMIKPEEKKAGVGATEQVVKKEDERKLCGSCRLGP